MSNLKSNENVSNLYNNIRELIEISKFNVAIKVNAEITMLYYNIGKSIKENILNLEKAEYGKSVIKELSVRLMEKYGKGYSQRNIFKMVKFYECFKDVEILPTVSRKLRKILEEKLIYSIKNAKIMLEQRNIKDYDFE